MNPELILLADTVHTLHGGAADGGTPNDGGTGTAAGAATHGPATQKSAAVQAVAIRDGVIVAVGSREDAASWSAPEVIDFGPAVITPGLTDCHMHPILGLELTDGCDLSGARDLDDVRSRLRDAAEATPADGWVKGWGLDPNVFSPETAKRGAIDDVVGGRPSLIRLFDGHGALASSRALELAGITGPRKFSQAAEIVCDTDGTPTGLLLEAAAMEIVTSVIPAEPFGRRKARLAELLRRFSRSGLTAAHVMDLGEGSLELLRALEDDGDLPLRLRLSPWCVPGTGQVEWVELAELNRQRGRRWAVEGIKLFVDGTVDNGTAWLSRPDAYGQSTAPFWPRPEEYIQAVRFFAARGIPTATHAIGDAGVAAVLEALESLPTGTPPAVHRIEHIETVPDALVRRFARSGLVASMQPSHCTHYSRADHTDNWSTRLGTERANNGWRCADLRSAGVTLGLGSDWPIAPFEPLPILADAQLRRRAGHPSEQPILPEQGLTAMQALEGYTSHAAKAAGEWDQAGSIIVGKRADFTVFDVDPLTAAPDELAASSVLATFVDGRAQHTVAVAR